MFLLEVFYATAIFFSNPINLFPIYESLYKLKPIEKWLNVMNDKKKFLAKFLIRLIIVFICFFICFFIPNFINFLSFIGAFLFPILGIYIPVLLNYSYFKRKGKLTTKRKIYLFTFLIVSVIIFTICTIDSVMNEHDTS